MTGRLRGGVRLLVATGVAVVVHSAAVLSALGDVPLVAGFFRHPDRLIPLKTSVALVLAWVITAGAFRRALGPGSIGRGRAAGAGLAGLAAYGAAAVARAFLPIGLTTSHKYGVLLSVMPPLVVGAVVALPAAARPARIAVSPQERAARRAEARRYRRSVAWATVVGVALHAAVIGIGRAIVILDDLSHSLASPSAEVARPLIVSVSYLIGMALVFGAIWSTQRAVADRVERFVTSAVIAGLASVAALTFFPYAKGTSATTVLVWVVATIVVPPLLTGLTFAIGAPPGTLGDPSRSLAGS